MKTFNVVVFLGDLIGPVYYIKRFIGILQKKEIPYYVAEKTYEKSYNCKEFFEFASRPNTVMVTFNNVGIMLNATNGNNYWKELNIPVFDYIVDHPRNYGDVMLEPPCELIVFTLDKDHVDYIKRYFPHVEPIFSPNGGTEVNSSKPIKDRTIDVLYMGSCQSKIHTFPSLKGFGDNGNDFYTWCITSLIKNPMWSTEYAIDQYFVHAGYPVDEHTLYTLKSNISLYIECYVRRMYKLEGIKALDDEGIHVDIYGDHWEDEEYPFSDNIVIHQRVDRETMMELVGGAKISLCFIPWFKKGCSEKNFDSMLNGAVCVSDHSEYLDDHYKDGENIIYFDLNNPKQMALDIKWLLEHPDAAQMIATRGFKTAKIYDQWENRFEHVLEVIENRIH